MATAENFGDIGVIRVAIISDHDVRMFFQNSGVLREFEETYAGSSR